jgi:hypothetical protein
MPDWSRRRALHAAVSTAVVALTGCSGEASVSNSGTPRAGSERVTEYETEQVRNADGAALVRRADATETETENRATTEAWNRGVSAHLTDADELSEYTFDDAPEATALARFARATDFETRSVYLLVRSIPACYDLRLVDVRRQSDSVTADFCRDLKPADVACERDDRDAVGVAIRLPFSGEGSGYGVSMSSSCGAPGRAVGEGGGGS